MHIKLHRSGPRTYVRIVEAYRDAGRVKHRTLATLGRAEDIAPEQVDALISGLLRVTGRADEVGVDRTIAVAPALEFGPSSLLTALWVELGLDASLRHLLRSSRRQFDVVAMLRVMVLHRLCDPDSKLGVLRRLQLARLPGIDPQTVTHQRLLRAMDALSDVGDRLQDALATMLRPMLDVALSIVFYDLTTIRVHGEGDVDDDLRAFGHSKDVLGSARQCVLGLIQTADGLPIAFEVFAGHVSEAKTLIPMLERTRKRFAIKRVIVVADRGLVNLDNMAELESLGLEFILAVPARRYSELIEQFATMTFPEDQASLQEHAWQSRRLIIAHDPERATTQHQARKKRIAEIEVEGQRIADKLNAQDAGKSARGRRASDRGAFIRFTKMVADEGLSRILKADLRADLFSFECDDEALREAERCDGKLVLVSNVADLAAEQIIERYKSLADIERGFRVLKSDIEIAPMYHRLPDRIRAHAAICFMALLLHRVMRMRLREANAETSPERALQALKAVQWFHVKVGRTVKTGMTALSKEQQQIYQQLKLPLPDKAAV